VLDKVIVFAMTREDGNNCMRLPHPHLYPPPSRGRR